MSVLVTGGAGYIGSHTCVELLDAGYDIVVVDNYSNSSPESLRRVKEITGKEFPVYEADLRDEEALDRIFSENRFDSVIHFAGLKSVGESVAHPIEYYGNNIGSTLSLCRQMEKHGVKKFVFSSSATVYGTPKEVPIREDAPLGPTTNPYGETKLMIERILDDTRKSGALGSVIILRYFNPIGAHESGLLGEDPNEIPNNLLPYITQVSVGRLKKLSVYGNDYDTPDGTCIRDYIHVVDLAKAHIKALERAETVKDVTEVYNVGTGKGYSVFEIIRAFEKASGKKIPYKVTGRRPGDVAVSYSDPSLARKVLGWEAEYDIDRMCRDAYRWQTMNPSGYRNDN